MAIRMSGGLVIICFLAGLIICSGVLGASGQAQLSQDKQAAKKDGQEPSPGPEGPKPGGPRFSFAGTWKLNEAKSKIGAGSPKNTTVVYDAAGDNVKVTVDGVDYEGKPVHNEWTGKFDGKDYPVAGDSSSDARSYKKIDDRTLAFTDKKNGKVTLSGRIVVSADGKSRTVIASRTDPQGSKVSSTAVYDKE